MESTPPERPTATRLPRRSCARKNARTARSALGGFLEPAIAHQALEALLDELLRLLFLHLPQRLDERLLQRRRGRLRIAVRAAERLIDDPVDEAERLQAARGDAERFGGLGRLFGALPQD